MFNASQQYKTFIMADLIGVKDALKNGTGAELLNHYWKILDAWATGGIFSDGHLRNRHAVQQMDVEVTVFSDTALIALDADYKTESIYECLKSFRTVLLRNNLKVYTILNRDIDLSPHELPALGGTRGNFHKVAGSGPAWINLYLANKFVEGNSAWHPLYSSYVVSKENLPQNGTPLANATFKGVGKREVEIFALE